MKTVKQLYKSLQLTNTFDTVYYCDVSDAVEATLGEDRFHITDEDIKTFLIEYIPADKGLLSNEMPVPNTINNKELLVNCIQLSQLPSRKKIHTGTERITFNYNWNSIDNVIGLLMSVNGDILTECYTEIDAVNPDRGIIRIEKYTVEPMDTQTISPDLTDYVFVQLMNNYRAMYNEFESQMKKQKELLKNLENTRAELEQFEEYHEILKTIL